jgi:hypothetical protein
MDFKLTTDNTVQLRWFHRDIIRPRNPWLISSSSPREKKSKSRCGDGEKVTGTKIVENIFGCSVLRRAAGQNSAVACEAAQFGHANLSRIATVVFGRWSLGDQVGSFCNNRLAIAKIAAYYVIVRCGNGHYEFYRLRQAWANLFSFDFSEAGTNGVEKSLLNYSTEVFRAAGRFSRGMRGNAALG